MKVTFRCVMTGLVLGLAGCTAPFGVRQPLPATSQSLAPPPVPVYVPTPAPMPTAPPPVEASSTPPAQITPAAPETPAPVTAAPVDPPPMPPGPVARGEAHDPEEPSEPAPPPAPATRPEDPFVEIVRCYREKRVADAQALLQKFDPARREVLQAILPDLARLGEPGENPPGPADLAGLLDQWDTLEQRLRSRARLKLDRVCFCRTIDGFGAYDPLPGDHVFPLVGPGQAGELVQVYLELRRFASLARGPYHETVLACTLEIRDTKHKVVWRKDRPARPERSRTPRQDSFLNCHFEMPQLPPGEYTLWIQVKDLTGLADRDAPPHRIATGTLEFRVGMPAQALSGR